jgi:hypothetical protein
MPALEKEIILQITEQYPSFKSFVETGTYMGDTIFSLEDAFEELYTIEIKEEFYNNLTAKYKGSKINFILGDSSTEIKNVLPRLKYDTIFFLDGHWSAGNTGKGWKDCPLYEEIQSIMSFDKSAIIIIDDVRLFGKGPSKGNEVCNWEDISVEKIFEITKKRLKEYCFLPSILAPNDRLLISLN